MIIQIIAVNFSFSSFKNNISEYILEFTLLFFLIISLIFEEKILDHITSQSMNIFNVEFINFIINTSILSIKKYSYRIKK